MKIEKRIGLPEMVKQARIEKGITQSALANQTGLSLRSIQRIEKGEVMPRAYSLEKLSEALETSFKVKPSEPAEDKVAVLPKKIILSLGSLLLIILGALAFLSQAANFPETDFELKLYWIFVVLVICTIQWLIWIRIKGNQRS